MSKPQNVEICKDVADGFIRSKWHSEAAFFPGVLAPATQIHGVLCNARTLHSARAQGHQNAHGEADKRHSGPAHVEAWLLGSIFLKSGTCTRMNLQSWRTWSVMGTNKGCPCSWEVQLGCQRLDFVPNECWLGCCTGRNPTHSAGWRNTTPHIKGLWPGGRDGTWDIFYKMVPVTLLNHTKSILHIYRYNYIFLCTSLYGAVFFCRFCSSFLHRLCLRNPNILWYLAGYVGRSVYKHVWKGSNSDGQMRAACGLGEHLVVHWDFPPISLLSSSIRSASGLSAPVEVRNDAFWEL